MSIKELLRFVILACVFATPFICLYVAESMFFPYITGKNFTFRILVEVMLGAWAILMFMDATYRPRFSWVLASAGLFLAVIAIADFTGVNPYRSFWSNYERMEGLIAHAHLFLYFIIAGSVMGTEKMWNWLFRTMLGVSFIVAWIAYKQYAGGVPRLDATFGNATYLAIYGLFNVFLSAFLYFRDGKENALRWLYIPTAIINGLVVYYTQTRGTLLGLIGGVFITFFLIALFDKEHPERKKYALAGFLGILLLIGGFFALRDSSFVKDSPTLNRMASISIKDATTGARFMIWQMSWEGFKERPILGWGQDNFLYVFSQHYNPKMWSQEPWFDRSHDVFFDWLIAGGALGLLSYLSMFLVLVYYLWFSRGHSFSVAERSILTGLLAGYFVHNIFVFDNLTSYIVFFSILGYIHTLHAVPLDEHRDKKRSSRGEEPDAGDVAIAGVVIIALTAGMIYFVNVRNINANVALINSIRQEGILVDDGKGGKKIGMEPLLADGLFGAGEVREQLAQLAMQAADPRVPPQIRKLFFDLTSQEFEKELAQDPMNLRSQSFAAAFYARSGEYDKALVHFKKAIEISPTRQSTYLDLAMMYSIQGRYPEAEATMKTAYELEPGNPDARLSYAVALVYMRKAELARDIMAPLAGERRSYDSRLLNAYGNSGYYEEVIRLVNEKIARGYAEGRDHFALAGALLQLGKKNEALAEIEKGMSLDASLKDQGEQLLKQVKGLSQ